MPDGGHGVDKQHPRAGEAHDGANAFPHVWLIAVNLAVGAEGLGLHKGAEVAALCGIGIQFRAFRTKGVTAVLLAAVQRNHVGNHFFSFSRFACISIIKCPPVYAEKLAFQRATRGSVSHAW